MGQYWIPVNLTKKEKFVPHRVGTGLKLREIAHSGPPGVSAALVLLLAAMPQPRGGGDFSLEDPPMQAVVGRWAGDKIAFVGDYAEDTDLPPEYKASDIFDNGAYKDISDEVCAALEFEFEGKFSGDGWAEFVERPCPK